MGEDISFVLDANYYKGASPSDMESGMKRQMILDGERKGMVSIGTLRTHKDALIENRIRRLTPTECARLQGFPDDWAKYGTFDDGVKEISDTQQYKVFGNAVTTKVIEALILRMLEKGCLASSMNKPEK